MFEVADLSTWFDTLTQQYYDNSATGLFTTVFLLIFSYVVVRRCWSPSSPSRPPPFEKTLALVLGVKGTLVKEVPLNEYHAHPNVQVLSYVENGNNVTVAVVVRPILEEVIQKLLTQRPNCVLILSPSPKNRPQAQAICHQLRVGGKTLEKLGFRVTEENNNNVGGAEVVRKKKNGNKIDIAAIRKWASLDKVCMCVVVNFHPSEHFLHKTSSDHIVQAPPFRQEIVHEILTVSSSKKNKKKQQQQVENVEKFVQKRRSSRVQQQWKEQEAAMTKNIFSATYIQPNLGVTLEFIQAFAKYHMGSLDASSASTDDVVQKIIKQRCLAPGESQALFSFAKLVQQGKVKHMSSDWVGKATHFVSHAWRYSFSRTLSALEATYGEDQDGGGATRFFWLDFFSLPQGQFEVQPLAWWATTFFHSVAAQPHFLLVWYTWDEPLCCRRTWCLWEIYAALHSGRNVEDGTLSILMPNDQCVAYRKQLLEKDVHNVANIITNMDVRKAECKTQESQEMIFNAIRGHEFAGYGDGFDGMNAAIKKLLYQWVVYSGKKISEEMPSAKNGTTEKERIDMGRLCHSLAVISHQRTNYDDAEQQFRMAIDIREKALGANHDDTLESIHRLGATIIKHLDSRKQDEGIALFRKVCETEGVSERKRLRAEKMIARAMLNKGSAEDIVNAVAILEACLLPLSATILSQGSRQEQVQAKNGALRSLFHCEKLLGTGLRMLGQYNRALKLHQAMTLDWGKLDGTFNDNYLGAMCELARTLHAMGRTSEAKRKMKSVVKTRIREDGREHRKTKFAMEFLASLSV